MGGVRVAIDGTVVAEGADACLVYLQGMAAEADAPEAETNG